MNQFLEDRDRLAAEMDAELIRLLEFWKQKMVDEEQGGFYGRIDDSENIHATAPKGSVLNARILWSFSAAHQLHPDQGYDVLAKRSFHYIQKYFIDPLHGGVYWMLDYQGKPLDEKKQVYAQAFVIYACAEYFKISKDSDALDLAKNLYGLIEKYSMDPVQNGYLEAFDREWVLLEDLRLSDKDANEVKTMNTHLHVMEGYSNLYKVYPEPYVKEQIKNLIQLFLDQFLNESTGQYKLFFDEDWNLKSDEISYGHDIETAWLLHEAALCIEDQELIKVCETIAVKTVQATLPFFDADGALFNAGIPGHIEDKEKHWWPQAEALVGLMNAYQVSPNEHFSAQIHRTWSFIKSKIIDTHNGEWIWGLDEKGQVLKEDKAGPWKCPYHNSRAMIEMIGRLRERS